MLVNRVMRGNELLNLERVTKKEFKKMFDGPGYRVKVSLDRMTGIGDYEVGFSDRLEGGDNKPPFIVWNSNSAWIELLD